MTLVVLFLLFFFFFNDTATTEIYTLSLHDALPIYRRDRLGDILVKHEKITSEHLDAAIHRQSKEHGKKLGEILRSEEHTSELQSLAYLVCRLLLEKKKKIKHRKKTTITPEESA